MFGDVGRPAPYDELKANSQVARSPRCLHNGTLRRPRSVFGKIDSENGTLSVFPETV
jgi:hypothetical protein